MFILFLKPMIFLKIRIVVFGVDVVAAVFVVVIVVFAAFVDVVLKKSMLKVSFILRATKIQH